MRRLFLSLLAALSLLPAALAQTPAKDLVRNIRFYYAGSTFPGEEENPRVRFLFRNGKENVSFQLGANAFSRIFSYTGPVPVPLFRERRTATGVEREDLGELRCPADWKGVLFIITRDPANARLPFNFYPVEYWAPSVPEKSIRIQNLCPYMLAAKVGPNQTAVGAQATVDLAFPGDLSDIPLGLAAQRADKWERILSTGISRPPQDKLLLLVFPRPTGAPRVLMIQDMPAPPPPPEAVALALPGRR